MAGLSKLNSACAEKHCGSQKKRERDHSEWPKSGEESLHTEAMVFFVLFYGGKSCSFLLVVFVSSDFSTESEFFY